MNSEIQSTLVKQVLGLTRTAGEVKLQIENWEAVWTLNRRLHFGDFEADVKMDEMINLDITTFTIII